MKLRTYTPLCLAALAFVSCEEYDVPAGTARITRLHAPAPTVVTPVAPKPEMKAPAPMPEVKPEPPARKHVAAQQQPAAVTKPVPTTPAPVAAPLPEQPKVVVKAPAPKPEVKAPAPAPKPQVTKPIVSQQQPEPSATYSNRPRLPIAPPSAQKRDYPLMPGQNRGLKSRAYAY